MISVIGVTKRFGGHEVLKGIDLEVRPSETMVVIGPSYNFV